MKRVLSVAAVIVTSAVVAGSPRVIAVSPVAPTTRTVYVTVTDKDGRPIPGLTVADFSVKEGGKDREIKSVAPPTARIKLALMIEESVTADSTVRQGVFDFSKRMVSQADIALILVGLRNRTVVEHTADLSK